MTKNDDVAYILIDAPVTAYSPKEEILVWIEKLKAMPDLPEVRSEIMKAEAWLLNN